jgi:hypothetical protein
MLQDRTGVDIEVSIDEELTDFDEVSDAGISTPIRAPPDRTVL